ncbi:hypothetical protein [Nocardia sp. alder85J]|uniref:hypothetical protein n=1 Tax=Nocardia sp. alder85J TaxID=2862949 RepID=UPI001CD7BB96|nr:hypothetical protein [Nocardia sp. alder85J]MCX4096126.1 hypothetical protein [Nocardia sp. alder85J]
MKDLITVLFMPGAVWWSTHLGPERFMAAACAVWHPNRSRRREAGDVLDRLLSKDIPARLVSPRHCECEPGSPGKHRTGCPYANEAREE